MIMGRRGQQYRHLPAFILLLLMEENRYGAAILNELQTRIPTCFADSAAVYRTLKDLEEDGALTSYWDTSESGPPKKIYQITERGKDILDHFKKDIEMRIANLQFFLELYEQLVNK